MNIEKTVLEIGLAKPLTVLHITDNHLPLYDENDSPEIAAKGKKRSREAALEALAEEMAYGTEHCDLIVHTGDLIDFASGANIAFAKNVLKHEKMLYIAGNHEYWRCDGGIEDMNYRLVSMGKLKELNVKLMFTSRVVGGVNFVGIDDAYHQVEDCQTERLRMEVEKGYPVVLFLHAPLFEQSLYDASVAFWHDGSAYLVGCDEAHLIPYPEILAAGQRPSADTKRFAEYVNGEKQIKAVLAGHVHFGFESRLPGGTIQYVTARGDRGNVRELTIL